MDAMIVDTPITDPEIRKIVCDEKTIEDRLERLVSFISYLDDSWSKLKPTSPILDWNMLSSAAKSNAEEVRRRIGA